jgi:hypothetical protein
MTIFVCKGAWKDHRGARHNFELESDRAERKFIKELVAAQYPCEEKDVIIISVRQPQSPHIANFQGYEKQAIDNSESTPLMSGSIGSDANSNSGGVQTFGLLFLGFLCFIIYMSAPVIALVGAGGLAFKVTKNRTHGLQWFKRTGIILLTTGLASMISFYGTIEAKGSIETWWNNIETEQVSYE